jgi:hypothetical protein
MPEQTSQTGTFTIVRNSDQDIKMRGLEVFVDGKFLTDIAYGKSLSFELEPGSHTILISNTIYKKQEDFVLAAGASATFQVANVVTGFGAMMISALGVGPYRVSLQRVS